MISLAGVAVNNAIVLIDYTNILRARGFALKEAVVFAGATRLRPVLLTAITTILGLVPMVTGASYEHVLGERIEPVLAVYGRGGQLRPVVVVPVLYFLLERGKVAVYRVLVGE